VRSTNFGPLVGLKMQGGGKVDLTRRGILGLSKLFAPKAAENLPAVVPQTPLASVAPPAKAPDVVAPLVQLAQKAAETPMSRRDVLKKAGQAAVSQATKGLIPVAAKEVVSEVAKSAVPMIDEAAAAGKIAEYAAKIWESSKAAKKAFKKAHGDSASDYFDDINDVPNTQLWAEVEMADPEGIIAAARAVGLDAETVAAKTGLPIDMVRKLAGDDGNLLSELAGTSGMRSSLEGVLEDGRPKEARRSTSYIDLWDDSEFLNEAAKKAIKEAGEDADEMDIYELFNDQMYDRWKAMERGNQEYNSESGYSMYKPETNLLRSEVNKQLLDDAILDDIWGQALDDGTYHYEDILNVLSKNGWKGLDK
jgi:hypothetical protein